MARFNEHTKKKIEEGTSDGRGFSSTAPTIKPNEGGIMISASKRELSWSGLLP
jgi:hypothetical protein